MKIFQCKGNCRRSKKIHYGSSVNETHMDLHGHLQTGQRRQPGTLRGRGQARDPSGTSNTLGCRRLGFPKAKCWGPDLWYVVTLSCPGHGTLLSDSGTQPPAERPVWIILEEHSSLPQHYVIQGPGMYVLL